MSIKDYYNTGDDSGVGLDSSNWYAQSFTASESYDIGSVKCLLYRSGTPGNISFKLYAEDGSGKPTGAALATATLDADTLTTNTAGEWKGITFASSYSVVVSTKYVIVFEPTSSGLYWRRDVSSPTYSGGTGVFSGNQGSSWTVLSTQDFMFETYSSADTINITGTVTGSGTISGDLDIYNVKVMTGTITAIGAISGDLSRSPNWNTDNIATIKRLIVIGNDTLYYEDV